LFLFLAHPREVIILSFWWQGMTSNSDDLEKALQQNLKLRRELGVEVSKVKVDGAKQMPTRPQTITTTEVRQGIGSRATFWVLIASIILAVIAGFALGLTSGWIPFPWSVTRPSQ
jgi:ABC-type dipeptide/oligopeptide/nickel transport system permease component